MGPVCQPRRQVVLIPLRDIRIHAWDQRLAARTGCVLSTTQDGLAGLSYLDKLKLFVFLPLESQSMEMKSPELTAALKAAFRIFIH